MAKKHTQGNRYGFVKTLYSAAKRNEGWTDTCKFYYL